MTLQWIAPNAGLLTTLLELDSEGYDTPVYQVTLVVEDDGMFGTPPLFFQVFAGYPPHYYEIDHVGLANTAQLRIIPLVRELDDYVLPEYAKPPGFTYDNVEENHAGKNYATYGSALSGGKTIVFTIRAWDATGLDAYEDSNGVNTYDPEGLEESTAHVDRTFAIHIRNNWSSDRDKFVKEYYEAQLLLYNNTEELTPEEWIIQQKIDGYYD